MEKLEKKVKKTIEDYQLMQAEEMVLVAVSGGPDSLALLQILMHLHYAVCVAHVNHGLRKEANFEEKFVREFCEEKHIPCFVKRLDLAEHKGLSLEEAGRAERYAFFEEVAKQQGCSKIATAHHLNDQVETVLMNLFRGSGLSGLKGMEKKRGNVIHPLLEVTREEIETYCQVQGLTPRRDESNEEAIYTRNKIRLELIPYLEKEINSNVVQNVARMAQIVSEEERFLLDVTDRSYNEIVLEESEFFVTLDVKQFNQLDVVIRKRIILKSIIKVLGNAKDIEKVHVDDMVKLCKNNRGGKFLTPKKSLKVSVLHGRVKFERLFDKVDKGGANEKTI